jgi:AcrR family transcriptional regulator
MSTTPLASKDARPYHHGDLPRVLLDTAVQAIAEVGPAAVSLRDLARRAGVSHAAPAYHFGDKAGLLTAVAADGFERLTATLREAYQTTGSFLEVGVAYVRFAVTHRAHFEVMFRPELYRTDDPKLVRARDAARSLPPTARTAMRCGQPWPHGRWLTGWPPCGSTTTCQPSWATTPSRSPVRSPATCSKHRLVRPGTQPDRRCQRWSPSPDTGRSACRSGSPPRNCLRRFISRSI